jgi:NADP-dependent 3-hydroxy acid dehydrogenase YdfG
VDVWWRTLDANVLGYVRTIQAVLPHLLEMPGLVMGETQERQTDLALQQPS